MHFLSFMEHNFGRLQLKRDGTREAKWRGNWQIEWVASTLLTTSEHDVSCITTADAHNSAASSRLNWHPHPHPNDNLNGLVPCAERRNLVSARVSSHFNWPLLTKGGREEVSTNYRSSAVGKGTRLCWISSRSWFRASSFIKLNKNQIDASLF
jgi:hypothetical protein